VFGVFIVIWSMLPAQASLVILRLRVLCGRWQRVFHEQENDSEEEDVGEEAEEEEIEPLDGLHAEVRLSLVHTLHSTIVLNYLVHDVGKLGMSIATLQNLSVSFQRHLHCRQLFFPYRQRSSVAVNNGNVGALGRR
jgi:hypothetical protein